MYVAKYIKLHQMSAVWQGKLFMPGRTFDLALRHEPIFPNKLIYVRLSVGRWETRAGKRMSQDQKTSNTKAC